MTVYRDRRAADDDREHEQQRNDEQRQRYCGEPKLKWWRLSRSVITARTCAPIWAYVRGASTPNCRLSENAACTVLPDLERLDRASRCA